MKNATIAQSQTLLHRFSIQVEEASLHGAEENASRGYQHHLNISEQWRFKCILYPHALFSSFPINCIDLLRVRGYTFIDQENSLMQQNCLPTQERSIPPLFPFGYIMVIHSASPKFHNTYFSSRKEMDKELSTFMEKK